jgi:hypothetical protein
MLRRVLKDLLIVLGGTVFFLGLCATVGISLSTRDTTPTVAAEEQEYDCEGQSIEQPPVWIPRDPHNGDE